MSDNAPNLQTITRVVKANGNSRVDLTGTFVFNINNGGAATGALSVILGTAGNAIRFDQGDKPKLKQGESFQFFTLVNNTGADITVTVAVGDGDMQTSQQVSISNVVSTNDATAQGKLDTLHNDLSTTIHNDLAQLHTDTAAVNTTLQSRTSGRRPLTDLTNASYAEAINTTTTAVSAGSNVNGILIHRASLAGPNYGTGMSGYVQFGSNKVMQQVAQGQTGVTNFASQFIENVKIPAGIALTLNSGSTSVVANCYYEVL